MCLFETVIPIKILTGEDSLDDPEKDMHAQEAKALPG